MNCGASRVARSWFRRGANRSLVRTWARCSSERSDLCNRAAPTCRGALAPAVAPCSTAARTVRTVSSGERGSPARTEVSPSSREPLRPWFTDSPLSGQPHRHVLHLEVLLDAPRPALAPQARLLHASERGVRHRRHAVVDAHDPVIELLGHLPGAAQDRKSTRLNSSHVASSYAVF